MVKKYNICADDELNESLKHFDVNLKILTQYFIKEYGEEFADQFTSKLGNANYIFCNKSSLSGLDANSITTTSLLNHVPQAFFAATSLKVPKEKAQLFIDALCKIPYMEYKDAEVKILYEIFDGGREHKSFDEFFNFMSQDNNWQQFKERIMPFHKKFMFEYAPLYPRYHKIDFKTSNIFDFYCPILSEALKDTNFFNSQKLVELTDKGLDEDDDALIDFCNQNQLIKDDLRALVDFFTGPVDSPTTTNPEKTAAAFKKLFFEDAEKYKNFDYYDFIQYGTTFEKLSSFKSYFKKLVNKFWDFRKQAIADLEEATKNSEVQSKFHEFKQKVSESTVKHVEKFLSGVQDGVAYVVPRENIDCVLPPDSVSSVIVHELTHVASSYMYQNAGGINDKPYLSKTGFRVGIDGTDLNEATTEYLTLKIYKKMHNDGFEIGKNSQSNCSYNLAANVIGEFLEKHLEIAQKAFFGPSIMPLIDLIGNKNFYKLNSMCERLIKSNSVHSLDKSLELWHKISNNQEIDEQQKQVFGELYDILSDSRTVLDEVEDYIKTNETAETI